MEINRHNYEAFLLDLLEGRLSVDDQQRLHDFLILNPDCAGELPEQEPLFLEIEKIPFPGAGTLKKELPNGSSLLTDHNFDLFSIARMEGDLTVEQEEAHRTMVADDAQKADQWTEWQKIKLIPEPVLLKEKKLLYHRRGSGSRVIWLRVVSTAAAVALLIVLFRMGPLLPQQELSMELSPETGAGQLLNTPDQPEVQKNGADPVEMQPVQETTELPVRKAKNPMMFSVKKEYERPVEIETTEVVVTGDDMQPRPVRISENRLNATSIIGEPVPDRIGPLQVPPVSIHLSSLSVAQLSGMDLQEMFDHYTEERDFSLWTIANAGIKGINRIAGSDISLQASRDEEGEISGFQLKSKRFSMTRPLGREE